MSMQDHQLTSSSVLFFGVFGYGEKRARLDGDGCWAAAWLNIDQYIQVDFPTPVCISGLILQGCPFATNGYDDWVSGYNVEYRLDVDGAWQKVKDDRGDYVS